MSATGWVPVDESQVAAPASTAPAGWTPVEEPATAQKPGVVKQAWDWVNKPVADNLLPEGLTTKDLVRGAAFEKLFGEPYIPGKNDFDTKAQEHFGESPTKDAIKTFISGAAKDTSDLAASQTSPLGIGLLAGGALTKVPGAVGTLAKVATGAAGAGFAGKGAADILEAGTGNTPEAWQQRLTGGAQLFGGVAGMSPAAKELLAKNSPVRQAGATAYRAVGNPAGLASTGEELLTQGIGPRASATGFKDSLVKAAPDLKAYAADSPIKNVQDLNDAIPEIKQKIWSGEVEPALQRQGAKPVNMQPVADAVRKQISSEMSEFDPINTEKLETLAKKLENARDVNSANSLLKYANGQLESYFAKYPAARKANLMNNPETAGWEAARSSLRDQFLSTLEDAGETGVRDARLRYGALTDIGNEGERRVNVADRAKPMSLPRILGIVGAPVTGGLSVAAGELANYLNKPDVLVRRGIANLPETAPIRTTPFQGPAPKGNLPGAPSLAQNYFESLGREAPEVEIAGGAGPRQNASGQPGGGGLEEQSRLQSEQTQGIKYFREDPGGNRKPLTGLGRQDLRAMPGGKVIRVDANGVETVLDEQPLRLRSTRPLRTRPE